MPGLLGMFTGRSDKLAWGVTALFTDTIDTFEEEIHEDGTYTYDGKREELREIKEVYRVKGSSEVEEASIYFTHHGSLLLNV